MGNGNSNMGMGAYLGMGSSIPSFPKPKMDDTKPKPSPVTPAPTTPTTGGIADPQKLLDAAKKQKDKLIAASVGGPLSPQMLDSGSPPTPDKKFFDFLNTNAILGLPPETPKSEAAAAEPTPSSAPTPPVVTDPQKSQFGTMMGSRSNSPLSQARQPFETSSGLVSTSSLSQTPRSLGTQSGAMRREARRLRREGYMREAGEMAGAASVQRLNEPSILTQEQRGRMDVQSKQADEAADEAVALQADQTKYIRDLIKKRQAELES